MKLHLFSCLITILCKRKGYRNIRILFDRCMGMLKGPKSFDSVKASNDYFTSGTKCRRKRIDTINTAVFYILFFVCTGFSNLQDFLHFHTNISVLTTSSCYFERKRIRLINIGNRAIFYVYADIIYRFRIGIEY